MRLWILVTRFDSRYVLKVLIAFNIVLVIYQFLTLRITNQRSSPCVIYLNSSTLRDTARDKVPALDNIPEAIQDVRKPEWDYTTAPNSTDTAVMGKDGGIPHWTCETRSNYSVLRDYIPSDNSTTIDYNGTITLSTQGSYEFLKHSEPLCQRWKGPISIAVYAPGDEFVLAVNVIYFLRMCRDPCVRQNISWHFVYDPQYGPILNQVSFPRTYFNLTTLNCSNQVESIFSFYKSTFRKSKGLPYPINVLRNVARLSSRTKHLLASDIELYPSINVIPMFMRMLQKERQNLLKLVNPHVPHVYVLPIFEVDGKQSAPFTKSQLVRMIKNGTAVFFHKWVCDACQNFPKRDKWINYNPDKDSLTIFQATKRRGNAWEPLYIGTNEQPLYEESLTWDGKRDKMSQMFEMCLLNYDLLILDNAFLVHAPGIKHIDPKAEKKRHRFMVQNNERYKGIISRIRKKHRNSKAHNCAT